MESIEQKKNQEWYDNWLLDYYEEEIQQYPLLSRDEEVDVAKRARNGEVEAINKLIVSNLRFVVNIAKQYRHNGLPLEDLISEGNIGVIKAAERFDETKGFKFITYAVWWIRQSILHALSETNRVIRLPFNRIADQTLVHHAKAELERRNGYEPSTDEISKELGLEEHKVAEALAYNFQIFSVDLPVEVDDDEDDITFGDKIVNENANKPDHTLVKEDLQYIIDATIADLPTKEAKVINVLYGSNRNNGSVPSDSLTQLAEDMNLTPERIRQLRRSGLKKVRENQRMEELMEFVQ